MAKRGFRVTAIDKDAKYIQKGEQLARAKNVSVSFFQINFLDYSSNDRFDVGICLWNSFGFNESRSDDILFLEKAFTSLDSGGVFVLGVSGKEVVVRDFQHQKIKRIDSFTLIKNRALVKDGSFLNAQWLVFRHEELLGAFQINQRLYSKEEISLYLSNAGFSDVSIYGDFDGSPYDGKAKQMLIVAKHRE